MQLENERISHEMTLFEKSNKEIRDYAKEENEKVKEEIRQFAKVLDSHFTEAPITGDKEDAQF